MTERDQAQLRAIVHGRVQGVNFRYYTVLEASKIGLTGWIYNRPDGTSVEVLAEGSRPQLERLIAFLRQGSPSAHVTEVALSWGQASGKYDSFEVRYRPAD